MTQTAYYRPKWERLSFIPCTSSLTRSQLSSFIYQTANIIDDCLLRPPSVASLRSSFRCTLAPLDYSSGCLIQHRSPGCSRPSTPWSHLWASYFGCLSANERCCCTWCMKIGVVWRPLSINHRRAKDEQCRRHSAYEDVRSISFVASGATS